MTEPAAADELKTPIRVEAREGLRVWVEFDDGVSGEADVSDFADKPEFACWRDRSRFGRVRLNLHDYLDWGLGEDPWEAVIDPDEIYSRITGLSIEDIYPNWADPKEQDDCDEEATNVLRVEPREGLAIWLEYRDGSSGVVDLSHLAGGPAFVGWKDRAYFESVHISDYGTVQWGDDLDLCEDALYLDLTGKTAEEVFPVLRTLSADA